MKNTLLTLIGLFFFTQIYGQRIEVSVFGNASFFSYVGNDRTSFALFSGGGPPYNFTFLTGNPYGSNLAVGYGAGIQTQYVAKSGFITGLQVAYENLRSDEHIVSNDAQGPTIGQFYFRSTYLNLNPYLGYRISSQNIKIDLMPGIDIALDGNAHLYGSAVSGGHTYTYAQPYGSLKNDVRARLGITAWYKRIGVAASYSHGLTNFSANSAFTEGSTTYSQVIRLGLIYRIL
jgi:hypothetical protein